MVKTVLLSLLSSPAKTTFRVKAPSHTSCPSGMSAVASSTCPDTTSFNALESHIPKAKLRCARCRCKHRVCSIEGGPTERPGYGAGPDSSPVDVRKGLHLKAILADVGGHLDALVDERSADGANPHHHQDDRDVPAGIGVAQGVVVNIGVAIERLGVPRLRH